MSTMTAKKKIVAPSTQEPDFYEAVNREGRAIKSLRNEERELHDKLYMQNRVPKEYVKIRDEAHTKTSQYRLLAKDYINRMFETVKDKLDGPEIKVLIFWDASQIWTERRVWQVFNDHPELKKLLDERKQQVGAIGGATTAQRVKEEEKEEIAQEASDIEIVSPSEINSGEIVSAKAISTILLNLRELEESLYMAISQAKGTGSHLLEIDFDANGLATAIRAVKSKNQAAQVA